MLLRGRAQLAIQIPLGQHRCRAACGIGAQQKRVQHHVMLKALRLHTVLRQFQRHSFHVVSDLRPAFVFQDRLHRVNEIDRQRARHSRLVRHANHRQRQAAIHGGFDGKRNRLGRFQLGQFSTKLGRLLGR